MLVYGSLAFRGMVFLGYDNGFQPSLTFLHIPWCVGILFHFLSFGIVGWISETREKLVSRLIHKGLRIPGLVLA